MAKPVLLTVDDDPQVLKAIERDLRHQYSEHYRIMRSNSGKAALETLKQLKVRNEPVALLLADQRMPQMDGVDFLGEAMDLFPEAKRALLTAYADTDAAISAINKAKLDHFFLKPWDPPSENLYPALDGLLSDWQASFHPGFDGMRVLGTRWAPKSYELRDFLARNHIPYEWMDVETADTKPEVRRLLDALGPETQNLPLVLFSDGSHMPQPSHSDIAIKVGLRTHAEANFYDLLIVGGGPAGLAAAVYGASEGLRTVMVEREAPGGQAGLSSKIENYLGFPAGLSGGDLAHRGVAQARRFGVEILSPVEAVSLRVDGPYRYVKLSDGSELSCHALMLAMGVQWRKLGLPGEERLQGAGIYYGAGTTEAMSCKDETVYIVGGANSAGQAAMNFSRYACEVIMLVRGDSLASTMSKYLIDEINKTPKIRVSTRSSVTAVHGDTRLEEISILCSDTNTTQRVPASSLFIFIGAVPDTDWLSGSIERDERGFILSGTDLMHKGQRPKGWTLDRDPGLLETNIPGVFVVGDVRKGSYKRVASGVGEGAVAVQFVHEYLKKVGA